jgi:hypothetical protein
MEKLSGMRKPSCQALAGLEISMHGSGLISGWDTLFLMIPFFAIMAMGMFRVDERLAAPKDPRKPCRAFCGMDRNGQPFLSDPDGRPWRKCPAHQIEATLEGQIDMPGVTNAFKASRFAER